MRLIKRLIELAFVVLVISLFMMNKDVQVQITYFGLTEPVTVAFWELVTICVSVGIIIAAVGDFITQLKWLGERRRLVKTDKEHQKLVDDLNQQVVGLESEVEKLRKELDEKSAQVESIGRSTESMPAATPAFSGSTEAAPLESTPFPEESEPHAYMSVDSAATESESYLEDSQAPESDLGEDRYDAETGLSPDSTPEKDESGNLR